MLFKCFVWAFSFTYLLFAVSSQTIELPSPTKKGGNNVCEYEYYTRTKTSVPCQGLWYYWLSCPVYSSVKHIGFYCCEGYTNSVDDPTECNFALCDGKTNNDGACEISYSTDSIQYRTGVIERNSGGQCVSPGSCDNCNDGFFPNGTSCIICPKIEHCYHRSCTNTSYVTCKYCEGEYKNKIYWRKYTHDIDDGASCQKVCSWSDDSRWCYPGNCTGETEDTCICANGYTGQNCDQMTEYPTITYNEAKLKTKSGEVISFPPDPNKAYNPPEDVVWTNEMEIASATGDFKAKYETSPGTIPAPDATGENHYVTDFRTGIIGGGMSFTLIRDNTTMLPVLHEFCVGGSEGNPKPTNYHCEVPDIKPIYVFDQWGILHNNDSVRFTITTTNGGYVEIMDRDNENKKTKYSLKGHSVEREYTIRFDAEPPYQTCVESGGSGCSQPVTAPDITDMAAVTLSWDGWTDDLSGMDKYQFQVFQLGYDGLLLNENSGSNVIPPTDISLTNVSKSITLPNPGMFSVIFTAFDKTGNHKSARKLIFYDNVSSVDLRAGKILRAPLSTAATNYLWVVEDTGIIDFYWTDRFINTRHVNNRWLNAVKSNTDVESDYDDKYGNRTTKAIDHEDGIFEFQVAYEVRTMGNALKDTQAFTSTEDFHVEKDTVNVTWDDGDKLQIKVKAIDIFGESNEDQVTVYRDTSPPIIENLWLTRGNRKRLYVHPVEALTDLTIEWDAYDYHSGLESISWKIFDNFTGTAILHGQEDLTPQKETTLAECQTTYGGNPVDCYCTAFWGCFHKHFKVTPEIKADSGLIVGKDTGIHDYDYYIEIQTQNVAKFNTTEMKMITIDLSPPHPGVVHDGVLGSPEVDFQQNMTLNAHWDGFFDRESGVILYLYTFSNSCQSASDMVIDSGSPDIIETNSTFAVHTVPSEGLYYVTVVAVNRALETSIPVCSDGVSVESTAVNIKEVNVESSKIKGGLIKDPGNANVWVLGSDRFRRLVNGTTTACMTKATVLTDIEMYPVLRDASGNLVLVDGAIFCSNTSGAPSDIKTLLPRSTSMFVEWMPVSSSDKVYDYEFGLSSTMSSALAPNIKPFTSTKQNPYINVRHADLTDGTEFYMVIKTGTKAGVEQNQTIGPFIIDTSAPEFTGEITLSLSGDFMVATWSASDFQDIEDIHDIQYSFAFGSGEYRTDLLHYGQLKGGGSCVLASPPTCTAVKLSDLDWKLHGHHTYHVTVRAENTVGLFTLATSKAYVHDVQLPSKGVVLDIKVEGNITYTPFLDIEDVDFQTDKTSLAARWSGFQHPHLNVTYKVSIGTTSGAEDVLPSTEVNNKNEYLKTGFSLVHLQTYYFTIQAVTSAGSVTVTSDGVTVVQNSTTITGVIIHDGKMCTMSVDDGTIFRHHDEDNRVRCETDIDFQPSLNSIQVYWAIPNDKKRYTPDVHWAVQERSNIGATWTTKKDYEHISTGWEAEAHDLDLLPGRTYRVALKLCAGDICFTPLYSDGVTVLANPPKYGSLQVTHFNITEGGGKEKVDLVMERFYDPDIEDETEKYNVIDKYEWSITDESDYGQLYTNWTKLTSFTISNTTTMAFSIDLDGEMDFSKCKRVTVRGYNKVKLWSAVSSDIKFCKSFDPMLIVPNIVIDAFGSVDYNFDGTEKKGYGKSIYLIQNSAWKEKDVDYTPYKNVISAVWPTLRHRNYTYAVLEANTLDVTSYYLPSNQLTLKKPCDHPDAIGCGNTKSEFMNHFFPDGILEHGHRYVVCIHADSTQFQHETWLEFLIEINICSDGVIVDLTPPQAGKLWIGNIQNTDYQSTTSHMYVNWESFRDVDEYGRTPHSSGIKSYSIVVGTTPGGSDVIAALDVGLINHIAFHNLQLQNGEVYYATVNATDWVNHVTSKTSAAVTVDTTPPEKTNNPITIEGRHIASSHEISACWKDVFEDHESGIQRYIWAIGSSQGYDDIMTYMDTSTNTCGTSDPHTTLTVLQGHAYYINVRAYNGAGLFSQASSWAFIVDFSAPIDGHVYDGKDITFVKTDIDFQAETSYIRVFWEGFHDPHSTIKEYHVSIGTCPMCQNVLPKQPIGITEEFELSEMHLAEGIPYYTSITACNTANLCTEVTSDGVVLDGSPPVPGVVQDGIELHDIQYQGVRTHIGAKWFGFVDPQSGLDRYEWRVGITAGNDDVIKSTTLHLREIVISYNISDLPVGPTLYVTVRAYNKAGLFVDSTSNGFIVDVTPPVISYIKLSRDLGSILEGSVVMRTSFKVTWSVDDNESFIRRQYLSIKSHRGGVYSLSPTRVNGLVREHVFINLDLHDGVKYYVTLISCNAADLCSTKESDAILVDTTAPSRGTFAVSTNSAADVNRTVDNYMMWQSRKIFLSWFGFTDLHTSVEYYMVTVGSSVMAGDLIEILSTEDVTTGPSAWQDMLTPPEYQISPSLFIENTGKPVKVMHSSSGLAYDEGIVQTAEIPTENLHEHTSNGVYVSIWAVNSVGLKSPVVNAKFNLLLSGVVELVRRCQAYTCYGHCICAPQDQLCPTAGLDPCQNVTQDTKFEVRDVLDFRFSTIPTDATYTPSETTLGSIWRITAYETKTPLWFEWSVGYSSSDEPDGIFDMANDRVWHETGQNMEHVFVLERGKKLLQSTPYSFFVRAWWTSSTYTIYKSDGIQVFTKTPTSTLSKGIAVTESVYTIKKRDLDRMKRGPFFVDWTNKFVNAESLVDYFQVYLSTFPEGYDVFKVEERISRTETRYNFTKSIAHYLNFRTKYYSNVIAVTHIGTHLTEYSDGFTVDEDSPSVGMVFDGTDLHDINFQKNGSKFGANWRGFVDYGSSVRNYYWCIGNTTETDECNIKEWEEVGLRTFVTGNLADSLEDGVTVYNKVYAEDVLGTKSTVSVSNGVTIDTTGPKPEQFLYENETNLVQNPSFETPSGSQIFWDDLNNTDICSLDVTYLPALWKRSESTCVSMITSTINLANDGSSMVLVRGSISQEVKGLEPGRSYRVTFVTSYYPLQGSEIASKEGFINFSSERQDKHVFLLYTRGYRRDNHMDESREILSWHRHTFYHTAQQVSEVLTIGSVDEQTGIFIDDVHLYESSVNTSSAQNVNNSVDAHIIFLHGWASVHAAWRFTERESRIVDYSWYIGHVKYGTRLQNFKSVGLRTFAINRDIKLVHKSYVYVSVIATNVHGMKGVAHADPIYVDLTAPNITEVNDGTAEDLDSWEQNEILVNWKVEDPESGVEYCEWAIGFKPFGNDLQNFTRTTDYKYTGILQDVPYSSLEGKTIYSTIRCHNKHGLKMKKSSDGFRVSNKLPNSNMAQVHVVPSSTTVYNAKTHYQSTLSRVRLKWTGFTDAIAVGGYKFSLQGPGGLQVKETLIASDQDYTFVSYKDLSLSQGEQSVAISAFNLQHLDSQIVTYNFNVSTSVPSLNDSKSLETSWNVNEKVLNVSWEGIFLSENALYYEVSAGSHFGGGDIVQWMETQSVSVVFGIPSTIKHLSGLNVYLVVRAVTDSGVYNTKTGKITLPKNA